MNTESKNERDLSTIVAFSSAVAFGAMLAVLQAVHVSKQETSFDVSIWTAIAFLVGFTSLLAYLRLVFTCGQRTPCAFRYGGLVMLGLMTSVALLCPLHELGHLAQRFAGLGVALCFVAAGLTMVYRIVLAAERDEDRQEAEEKNSTVITVLFVLGLATAPALAAPVQNIVLVHGAWADGSGWKGVYDILVKDGYNVSIVQEPETSFREDVAATKRVLAQQAGPCILVAHSYGGAVITEAGTDPSVAGLVYIAAHMPDAGENEADDGKRFPSDLSKSTAIKQTTDGFTYLDPAQFHEYFAADLPAEQAAFMARSQVLNAANNFRAVITTPAWRSKPSWMLVAAGDRAINPDLERWYAKRARSHVVEVPGASHSVYVSRPKEVAALIKEAASHAE
jgi:pimeloyl-ACP methyl ester carboxylesterase